MGSVGLMLGQLIEANDPATGRPRMHLQVQGALPGGSAEASGKFQAGDLISAVDGVSFAGRSLSEAKKMFVGHEGTMLLLSAVRPTTGKEFSVSLRRMALAKAESPIRTGEGVGNSGGKTYTTSF